MNCGNNILPMIPELQEIYDSPKVRGALKSILGEDYMMHPHRHPHSNPPGFRTQRWHQDSYWGFYKQRHHVAKWYILEFSFFFYMLIG
jgi:hypothetical protein